MAESRDLKPVYLLTGSDRPKIETALDAAAPPLPARGGRVCQRPGGNRGRGGRALQCRQSLRRCPARGRRGRRRAPERRGTPRERLEGRRREGDRGVPRLAGARHRARPRGRGAEEGRAAREGVREGRATCSLRRREAERQHTGSPSASSRRARAPSRRPAPRSCELVGEDLNQLANEIDKLALWAGGEPIGEHEVELLVAAVADTPTFALTDAWARRDTGGTLEASETIFEREGRPRRDTAPRLAAALGQPPLVRAPCQRLAAEGVRPRDAAATLKRHPFYVEKVFAQAANFSEEELRAASRAPGRARPRAQGRQQAGARPRAAASA